MEMDYYLIIQDLGYYNDIIHGITIDEEEAIRLYTEIDVSNLSIVHYTVNISGKVILEKTILKK